MSKLTNILKAALIAAVVSTTAGCSAMQQLADRNDAVYAKHADDPSYKYVGANWHYFEYGDEHARVIGN